MTHNDIKPNNLLFDKNFNIKISDFGLSEKFRDYTCNKLKGTGSYIPPEMYQK